MYRGIENKQTYWVRNGFTFAVRSSHRHQENKAAIIMKGFLEHGSLKDSMFK